MRPAERAGADELTALSPASRALDVDLVKRLISEHLCPGVVTRCYADYVRYKGSDGCLVGYSVWWRGADPGHHVSRVTIRTAPTARLESEAERFDGGLAALSDGWRSYVLVPEHGMLLLSFPLDRVLVQLPRLLDPIHVRRLLQRPLDRSLGRSHRIRRRASRVKLVRYKPERRAILLWDLGLVDQATTERRRERVYLRYHSEARADSAVRVQRAALAGGIRCPEVLALLGPNCSVERELAGKRWLGIESQSRSIASSAGRLLAQLHAIEFTHPDLLRHGAREELQLVMRTVEDLRCLHSELGAKAAGIALALAAQPPIGREDLRIAHGDFHRGQFLVSEGEDLGILDFDRVRLASTSYDLACFLAHTELDLLPSQVAADVLQGYRGNGGSVDDEELAWYRACALLRMAIMPFRCARASWFEEGLALLLKSGSQLRMRPEGSLVETETDTAAGDWQNRLLAALRARGIVPPPATEPHRAEGLLLGRLPAGGVFALVRDEAGDQRQTLVMDEVAHPMRTLGPLRPLRLQDDEHLPGAMVAGDPDALRGLLDGRLDVIEELSIVSHHPQRRAVLRVRGSCAGVAGTLYVKLLRRRHFDRARELFSVLPRSVAGLRLALPVDTIESACALVLEEAPGHSLHRGLWESRPLPAAALARAFRSLASTQLPLADSAPRGIADEIQSARRSIQLANATHSQRSELLDALLELEGDCGGPQFEARSIGLVHGDLHDKQIFCSGGRVTLIDVEGMTLGDPRIDVVNLLVHLKLRRWQGARAGNLRPLFHVLWAELCEHEDPRVLRALEGVIKARLAGVYARRPGAEILVNMFTRSALQILGAHS